MTVESGPYYTGTLWEKLNQNGTDVDSNASLAHGWGDRPGVEPERLRARRAAGDRRATRRGSSRRSRARSSGRRARSRRPPAPLVSRWRRGDGNSSFQLTMSAPDGTSGTVAVPLLGRSRTIAMDGHAVWQDGAPVGGVTAVAKDGAVEFSGVTGAHTFAWGTSTATPTAPSAARCRRRCR